MCCGGDRNDCGCASGRGYGCVCEMDCGVVDWVMVGERLSGVVCAKASAKLWSRDFERRHHASASAIVKALCGGYELVYERRMKVFLVLALTKFRMSELHCCMTRASTHDALAVTTKTTRVPLAANLSFNRDNNDIRQPMALCSPAASRFGSPALGSRASRSSFAKTPLGSIELLGDNRYTWLAWRPPAGVSLFWKLLGYLV